MSSRQLATTFALLQAEGPDASARFGGHIITRVIIGLVVGAVLATVMGAIFGLVLYLIFGWLLAGVNTFLGLNIFKRCLAVHRWDSRFAIRGERGAYLCGRCQYCGGIPVLFIF
jgi:hypothetical protein